jgi:hypothetical protein
MIGALVLHESSKALIKPQVIPPFRCDPVSEPHVSDLVRYNSDHIELGGYGALFTIVEKIRLDISGQSLYLKIHRIIKASINDLNISFENLPSFP